MPAVTPATLRIYLKKGRSSFAVKVRTVMPAIIVVIPGGPKSTV